MSNIPAPPEFALSIGKVIQSVGRSHMHCFNSTYHPTGTLWERCYQTTIVDSEQYPLTLMRYIELNPVRSGILEHPGNYP